MLSILLNSCISVGQLKDNENRIWEPPGNSYKNLKKAYFASGCFWCVEAIFESVKGVYEVYSGYSGGYLKNPTYFENHLKKYFCMFLQSYSLLHLLKLYS